MAKNVVDPELLMQHSAALLALGRSLLDEHAGEDLVQDAYVAALQCQPEPRNGLGPWLATVVRNLALRQNRTVTRRNRREMQAAREEAIPAAGDVASETDLLRRLAAAVHELDEPYRTTVHLRYWQGLTPTQIAERLAIPRNTVRSRLQRGLERLRSRMDVMVGSREAWSLPLLSMWKSAIAAKEIGLVSVSASGIGVIMSKWTLSAAALLLVALTYWAVGTSELGQVMPMESGGAPTQVVELGAAKTPEIDAVAMIQNAQRQEVRSETRAESGLVTISGRCIDATTSQALAGCTIGVRGFTKAWYPQALDHDFSVPALVQSSEDGRFEISFVPTSERIKIAIDAPGVGSMSGWWDDLDASMAIDLGDIPMQLGCAVSGQVVDSSGAPQVGVNVSLTRGFSRGSGQRASNMETAAPISLVSTSSGPNGHFAFDQPLTADAWYIGVEGSKRLPKHEDLVIVDGQNSAFLTVVTARELDDIRGVVLDEEGRAVANALVGWVLMSTATSPPVGARYGGSVRSDEDGRFRLVRIEGVSEDPVHLRSVSNRLQTTLTEEAYPWGSDDLQVVMKPAISVRIEVVDLETGAAITDYAVRISPDPRIGYHANVYHWSRQGDSHHENGTYSFSAKKGDYVLLVEPGDNRWATSDLVEVQVAEPTRTTQRIELAPRAYRRLRVVDTEGLAIVATEVQLVMAVGDNPVTLSSKAMTEEALIDGLRSKTTARLVQAGQTDASGEILLGGASGKEHVIRILGPGHAPKMLSELVLNDDPSVLVVTVDGCGSLLGRVEPESWIAHLHGRERARLPENTPFMRKLLAARLPQVWLIRSENGERHPREGTVAVREDGTFHFENVPVGDWKLEFTYHVPGGGILGLSTRSATLSTVEDLLADEIRKIIASADHLQSSTIHAQVFVAGELAVNKRIRLDRRPDHGNDRGDINKVVRSDSSGHIEAELPPGEYSASIEVIGESSGKKIRLYGPFSALLPPGEVVQHVFHLQHLRLRAKIIDVEGSPVINREFMVIKGNILIFTEPSNEDGLLVLDPVPVPGPFYLATWPDALREQADQMAYIREHPYPEWMDVLIRLGPVHIPPQRKLHEIELVLDRK